MTSPREALSVDPADVVRRQYLASATGDMELWRTAVADDVEWTESAGFPLAGTYRTPDAVVAGVFERLAEAWDGWVTHDDTYVVDGERVVVLARYSATNRATGKPMEARVAHCFTVRGGRIVRFEQIVDSARVLAAMP
ncbi:nuclear transport factor 2 family protein [Streptomyces sp. NPDC058221]|uniref:nuclear transport factor 2 family protein n=1 Tax=Streptomyces sp. NPDC058221 TaxID=3346388 RepID=UPI0036E4F674